MSTGFGRGIIHLGNNVRITVAVGSANVALPNSARNFVYLLTTDTDCYVIWGNGSQTATSTAYDLFKPAGMAVVVRIDKGDDNMAAIRDTADGVLSIHEITPE